MNFCHRKAIDDDSCFNRQTSTVSKNSKNNASLLNTFLGFCKRDTECWSFTKIYGLFSLVTKVEKIRNPYLVYNIPR